MNYPEFVERIYEKNLWDNLDENDKNIIIENYNIWREKYTRLFERSIHNVGRMNLKNIIDILNYERTGTFSLNIW